MQSTVSLEIQKGIEGAIATSAPFEIRGATEGYYAGMFIPFGRATAIDPADPLRRRIILRNDAGQKLAGISVKNDMHGIDEGKLLDGSAEFGIPEGEPIGLLTRGDIYVYSVASVTRGGNANSLIVAGAGENKLGRFTASATAVFEGVVFADTIAAPGLVRISLYGNGARF